MKRVTPRATTTSTGKKTYELDFIGADGKRHREYFQDKILAKDRANTINTESVSAYNIPEQTKLEAHRCEKLLDGSGLSLTAAVEYALRHAALFHRSPSIKELADRLVHDKRLRRPQTVKGLRQRLDYFTDKFGDRQLHDLTRDDCREWLAEMETDDLAPITIKGIADVASQLYNHFMQEHCDRNPFDNVERPKYTGPREIKFFAVTDCQTLLETAVKIDFIWYVVLGMYLGIRPTELERLSGSLIRKTDDEMIIRLPSSITKTQQTRVIEVRRVDAQGNSDPLGNAVLDWLKDRPVPSLIVNGVGRSKHEALKNKSKVAWVFDGLRHTAATYHVSRYQDTVRTGYLLGHTKPGMLQAHYRGLCDAADAVKFYALRPAVGNLNA